MKNKLVTTISGILFIVGILFTILLLNSSIVSNASASGCTDCNASYTGVVDASSQHAGANAAFNAQITRIRQIKNSQRVIAARHIASGMTPHIAAPSIAATAITAAGLNPSGVPDYFGMIPNYANSPLPVVNPDGTVSGGIRKFVDSLPGVGPAHVPGAALFGANNLGQYIPLATADTTTYNGSDYYEIGLVQYTEKMHSDLNPTTLRGYVQIETPVIAAIPSASKHIPLQWPNGTNITNATGVQVFAVDKPHYLGPLILAQTNRPVRVKFTNFLPTGAGGNLFIPVDTTIAGAGAGPLHANGTPCDSSIDPTCANYTQNRATIHLHGGNTPWISDGSQDMWTTPYGENTSYPRGVSTKFVPDMDGGVEPNGTMTFYYTNQQSARLMFYHDHAYGITRLNVYVGVAAAYLLRDSVEAALEANGTIPGLGDNIPLVIQDKAFLPDSATLAKEDPTWPFTLNASRSDLWFPHVYMPNQNPALSVGGVMGVNPMGRWDYGPWVNPPSPAKFGPLPNPLCPTPLTCPPGENPQNPGTPNPSIVPEAFVDTTVVNGNVYPYLDLGQKAYRFRILDAANDRGYNLQLYYASTAGPFVRINSTDGNGSGASAAVTVDANGNITGITITSAGAGYTAAPNVTVFDIPGHTPAGSGANITAGVDLNVSNVTTYGTVVNMTIVSAGSNYSVPTLCKGPSAPAPSRCTEITMVPAVPGAAVNASGWNTTTGNSINPYSILDGRVGGVPDPASIGPNMIQVGTEGGLLPAPVVIPNRPVGFDYNNTLYNNTTIIGPLNVREKALFLDPAERADVIVDFSQVPDNSTLILYSDAPTPVTGADVRYDYFTDDPDNTLIGGASSTLPGYGPNIRTLMQFRVSASLGTAPAFNLTNLTNALPIAYAKSQDKPIVPEANYSTAFNANYNTTYVGFADTNITFTPVNSITSVTMNLTPKSINDGFDPMYGGLYTMLGVELPATRYPIPYNQWDPPTEIIKNGNAAAQIGTLADGTQVWRIYSNSVDTHPMHWHMFNVQVINRIGQLNGDIKPPDPNELGWKETLRVNPLEDTIIALRPIKPNIPWDLPNNIRPLDVTMPLGTRIQFQNVDPSNQTANVTNHLVNFGEEFVWHCHILGHEEAMIMRPISLVVTPNAPSRLTAANSTSGVTLAWTDNSTDETNWTIQRATSASGPWTTIAMPASTTGPGKGTKVRYIDNTVAGNTTYYYNVSATNIVGDTTVYPPPAAGYPNMAVDSLSVNTSITTQPKLSILANLTTVRVGTPTPVAFNVTSNGTPVTGLKVTLSGNATGSNTTNATGIAIISVNAKAAGTITATAAAKGYISGITTINAVMPLLTITANLTSVRVGIPTSVAFNVTSNSTPVAGSKVTLSGNATGSGKTNTTGIAVISVNATASGTITATATAKYYTSGNTTINAV